jgi:hypothetical protein
MTFSSRRLNQEYDLPEPVEKESCVPFILSVLFWIALVVFAVGFMYFFWNEALQFLSEFQSYE